MTMDAKKFFDFTNEPVYQEEVSHDDFTAIVFRLAHMTQDQLLGLQEEVEIELNFRENAKPLDVEDTDNDE